MANVPFTVGIVQDDATDDAAATLAATVTRVREAAARGAQIVCLKELFNAPCFCKSQRCERFDIAEPIPWPTRFATIGVLICWDQWYPEAARITSLLGAEILLYPTAIGWHPAEKSEFGAAQVDAWRTMQRSHAIANGVFVASPNRVGHEEEPGTGGIEFFGNSFIADPFGRVLAQAGTAPEVLVARCDPALIDETRRNWP